MSFGGMEDFRSTIVSDLRIVLLGKTGSGKSATGNTILGKQMFHTEDISLSSLTTCCQKETGHLNERSVSVIDTPGVFDTTMTAPQLKSEIENCIGLSLPGPHIFLLVIRLDARFTEEENNTVKWIKDNFGEEASKYTMVLFTRGDGLKGRPVESVLAKNGQLKQILSDCKAGYMVFDNTCLKNRTQVADLFEQIDKIVELNGTHYTSSIYEEVQRKIKSKEWWSKCGNVMHASSSHLLAAAIVAASPVAGAFVAAEEAVLPSAWSLLMFAGAGVTRALGGWIKPNPTSTEQTNKEPGPCPTAHNPGNAASGPAHRWLQRAHGPQSSRHPSARRPDVVGGGVKCPAQGHKDESF